MPANSLLEDLCMMETAYEGRPEGAVFRAAKEVLSMVRPVLVHLTQDDAETTLNRIKPVAVTLVKLIGPSLYE